MALTPLDIEKKEFKRTFRGYSEVEVDEFLDLIINDYEVLYRENMDYKDRNHPPSGTVGTVPAPRGNT